MGGNKEEVGDGGGEEEDGGDMSVILIQVEAIRTLDQDVLALVFVLALVLALALTPPQGSSHHYQHHHHLDGRTVGKVGRGY